MTKKATLIFNAEEQRFAEENAESLTFLSVPLRISPL